MFDRDRENIVHTASRGVDLMDLTVLMSLTIALFLHCWGVTRPDAVCTKKCECQCGNKRKNVTCKTNDIFILKVIGFGFSNRDVQSKLL